MSLARPENTSALTEGDFDLLDDGRFRDFQDWDARRVGDGAYHLGDYSIAEVFDWLRWLKCQRITLRRRLEESKSARHIRDLEYEVGRLTRALEKTTETASMASLETLREENTKLRGELTTCKREMTRWHIAIPRSVR